ncbi:DUF4168 domain-containing protein [Natronospirillum operosum]|uniref:DUF4168 domain-containing protein n=1 Tax=Natronospirillum operosum TaxID=2759953 RepID=A0A4Z0W7D3_9GAMM|nr:DUF4168 domain-containing protein [Natronospirillum operosum]TGG93964.1 DUF4168 domain-containing protein [Natronospirillum operosum]
MTRISALLAALMMSLGIAAFAGAQEDTMTDMPGEADISDTDLERFVDVQTDIQEITADYSSRLEGVDDPDEAAQLQQEASQMMVEAVEDTGLDVATYNNIAVALETDEELRERVQSMMN